ncbi:MAG TPA: hypothetical protein VFT65_18365, partial [Candidatus Angelobacter sp.]|nr:hypothetical protein [Candidatus Angelobacter sp.]
MSETVVLWETLPPVALMVTVEAPVAAVLLAVNVSVELPEPGAAIEVGLNAAVTPVGRPVAESEIAELNPPLTVVETVELPELPWVTERLPGETLKVKFGDAAALIVTEMGVVCVVPPPVALTVALKVPVVAVLLAVKVSVEF